MVIKYLGFFMLFANGTRLTPVKKADGFNLNIFCLPGGPGLSSESLRELAELIETPGAVWLVDFPENGDNHVEGCELDCQKWGGYLIDVVKEFDNAVILGHSFGGHLALGLPELENLIKGLIIVNSSPALWLEAQAKEVQRRNLPSLQNLQKSYADNPCDETFRPCFISAIPHFVIPEYIDKAKRILSHLPYNHRALKWWVETSQQTNWTASWIPKGVPTFIISGREDVVTPYYLFEQDARFHRPNIKHHIVDSSGHFCWIERPDEVKSVLDLYFSTNVSNANHE